MLGKIEIIGRKVSQQLSNSIGIFLTWYWGFQHKTVSNGPERILTRVYMAQNAREQNPINIVLSNSKLMVVHPQQTPIFIPYYPT